MKIFIYVLMVLALLMMILNMTKIDFQDPLGKDSIVAVITTLAAACSILVLAILRTSQQIRDKMKGK